MRCYVKLQRATSGSSGSSSVVDDSGRPINWLRREGGIGVIQVVVALETIWVKIDCYLGRNGRGTTGCMYVCVCAYLCVVCVCAHPADHTLD